MKINKRAFSLMEALIVVSVIALLVAIAVPNFMEAWRTGNANSCIANQKQLKGAIAVWATENAKIEGGTVSISELVPEYMKRWPSCGGLSYVIPIVGQEPSCPQGLSGHELP